MSQLNSPLVSIGVPIHNGEKYLYFALDSLKQQSYKHIEIIVSDDVSSDATDSICKKFMKLDPRIRYFHQKQRLGMIDNFNFVFQKAKGKYFLWHAQDDIRTQKALEVLVDIMERYPKAGLASSNFKVFNENVSFRYTLPFQTINTSVAALKIFLTYPYTVASLYYGLYRTTALKKIRGTYNPPFTFLLNAADTLTVFKVLLNSKLVFSDKMLFFKRDSGHYINKYEVLQEDLFSHDVIQKILRYCISPLIYGYITLIAGINVCISSRSFKEEMYLIFVLIRRFLQEFIGFIAKIILGIFYVIKGFLIHKPRK